MSSAGCLRLKSPKSTNYCHVTGSLLPRTPAELPFLFTGTIETKRSVTTLPCDTHERRRTIVFVAISLRHPACVSGLTLTFRSTGLAHLSRKCKASHLGMAFISNALLILRMGPVRQAYLF